MAEWINQTAAVWWSWMAAVSVQAAVLILLVGAADMVLRRWAWPQLRYALYLLVLAKLVLGPAFTSPASVTWRLGPWTDWTVQVGNRFPGADNGNRIRDRGAYRNGSADGADG